MGVPDGLRLLPPGSLDLRVYKCITFADVIHLYGTCAFEFVPSRRWHSTDVYYEMMRRITLGKHGGNMESKDPDPEAKPALRSPLSSCMS